MKVMSEGRQKSCMQLDDMAQHRSMSRHSDDKNHATSFQILSLSHMHAGVHVHMHARMHEHYCMPAAARAAAIWMEPPSIYGHIYGRSGAMRRMHEASKWAYNHACAASVRALRRVVAQATNIDGPSEDDATHARMQVYVG